MEAIGRVEAIYRYPVKSMRGERITNATLGWHGLDGDRRFAFRRIEDRSFFPWLTAGKLAGLLQYEPICDQGSTAPRVPTHVRTPGGEVHSIFSDELAAEVSALHKSPVQMTQLKDGIFDDASISILATDTVTAIADAAGLPVDARRFRPNLLVRLFTAGSFQEDQWLNGVLTFGEGDAPPAIAVTRRDVRCAMINLDPDTAMSSPEVLKAVVRINDNNAGVYGTVTRTGGLTVGQSIYFRCK